MILSGSEIKNRKDKGDIVIVPFNESNINSNSYNITLDNKILIYDHVMLDMKINEPTTELTIPETGFILHPEKVYLAQTVEHTETYNLVPMIEGRSGVGRLGINIHVTAGFGDVGFRGKWVLELSCIHPVRIYPFIQIGQIYYHTIEGDIDPELLYRGSYQDTGKIISSKIWKELTKK